MLYEKEIKAEIDSLGGLKQLVEIYAEIASIRMIKIRQFVLQNRNFLNSIHDIYRDVLSSYAKNYLYKNIDKGKISSGKITFLSHNGKTVAVLVSANTGFYGEVVQNTFREFLSYVRKHDVEVTIIGKLGLTLFNQEEPGRPYTFFNLPDYGMDKDKLAEVLKHLVQYEEIQVYYGEYISVITQKPKNYVISAGSELAQAQREERVDYIFEPNIEKILEFFETEIFASLFDQTVRESQLAKLASRILAMDTAGDNIEHEIGKMNLQQMRIVHGNINKKQVNSMIAAIAQI